MGGESIGVPPRAGDPRFSGADNSKAKKLLNWEPTVKLEDGVAELKQEWGVE